ncbi:DUF1272 domain-containing protein [Andreprevotia lacus]|uniref:DUF1272 domain-containing protein n=1 Tax=Andreprevotia lacus TaxID=1121000 RepID=UPI00111C0D06|nr:DUF1272 domain-containing protein [Andreprevotia lacus]
MSPSQPDRGQTQGPDRDVACICSFECTFCADCTAHLQACCPNCGGELVARPRRPAQELLSPPGFDRTGLQAGRVCERNVIAYLASPK